MYKSIFTMTGQTKAQARRTSHFGCLACKRAKVKCDEKKPSCSRCEGQRIQCEYSDHWRNLRRTEAVKQTQEQRDAELELKLMHHWCSYTCYTLSAGGFDALFQRKLPEIAFTHRYLMDSIFMLTAAHLNYQQPDSQYQDAIEKYKYSVITALRDRIGSGVTRDNGEAVFTASALLAIYSMICDTEREFKGVSEVWMPLFQGAQQIYMQIEWYRHESCFAELHEYTLSHPLPDGKPYLHNYTKVLDELRSDQMGVYLPVVQMVSRLAHAIMSKTNDNILVHIISWIMRLPREFVTLIDSFDPCALVIMANVFQTLSHLQDSWLFKEYAKLHQQRIVRLVPANLRVYLIETPLSYPPNNL